MADNGLEQHEFDAMCPHCGGKGCGKCDGGAWKVRFAKGDIYTRHCINITECGFDNGGKISKTFPDFEPEPCVICGGTAIWMLAEEADRIAPPEPAWVKNQDKFRCRKLERDVQSLLGDLRAVRKLALEWCNRELTVTEAQLLDVCRICKGEVTAPFELQYGKEYAHTKCLGIDLDSI